MGLIREFEDKKLNNNIKTARILGGDNYDSK